MDSFIHFWIIFGISGTIALQLVYIVIARKHHVRIIEVHRKAKSDIHLYRSMKLVKRIGRVYYSVLLAMFVLIIFYDRITV